MSGRSTAPPNSAYTLRSPLRLPFEPMFTITDRQRVHDRVLEWAAADPRVTAGAVVGSLALGGGDRWSDLDLTFAVTDAPAVLAVLGDWTDRLAAEFGAVPLFDLPSGPSLYRVFLLPGCLQCDLSCTPAAEFGATSPKFQLLFGQAVSRPHTPPPAAGELFGYAVHHALRAYFCVERGRLWQAEYWISGVRDYALSLACRRRGLPARNGRGFDELPDDVLALFGPALVTTLEPRALRRALAAAIKGLLLEAEEVRPVAERAAPLLQALLDA